MTPKSWALIWGILLGVMLAYWWRVYQAKKG